MNRHTPIYEQYGFSNMEEFHQYIIDSKINGNHSQVKNLLKEMSKKEVREFIAWTTGQADEIPADQREDYKYCQSLATDVLMGED